MAHSFAPEKAQEQLHGERDNDVRTRRVGWPEGSTRGCRRDVKKGARGGACGVKRGARGGADGVKKGARGGADGVKKGARGGAKRQGQASGFTGYLRPRMVLR